LPLSSVYLMTTVCLGVNGPSWAENLLTKVNFDVGQTVFVGVRVEQTLILSYL